MMAECVRCLGSGLRAWARAHMKSECYCYFKSGIFKVERDGGARIEFCAIECKIIWSGDEKLHCDVLLFRGLLDRPHRTRFGELSPETKSLIYAGTSGERSRVTRQGPDGASIEGCASRPRSVRDTKRN